MGQTIPIVNTVDENQERTLYFDTKQRTPFRDNISVRYDDVHVRYDYIIIHQNTPCVRKCAVLYSTFQVSTSNYRGFLNALKVLISIIFKYFSASPNRETCTTDILMCP